MSKNRKKQLMPAQRSTPTALSTRTERGERAHRRREEKERRNAAARPKNTTDRGGVETERRKVAARPKKMSERGGKGRDLRQAAARSKKKRFLARKVSPKNASANSVPMLERKSRTSTLQAKKRAARLRAQFMPKATSCVATALTVTQEPTSAAKKKFAVLIDAENVNREFIPRIFREVEQTGEVLVKVVFADWSRKGMDKWAALVAQFGMSAVQVFSHAKKSSSDMHMTVDGIDLLRTHPELTSFAIVSSDSDFRALAKRLREAGKEVVGFGDKRCSAFLVGEFTSFKFVQDLPSERLGDRSEQATEKNAKVKKAKTRKRVHSHAPVPRQSQAHSAQKHSSFCQQEITKHMMEGWSETQNEQGWSNAGHLQDQLIRRGIDSTDFFPGLTKFTKILRKTNLFDIEFRDRSSPYCRPKIVKQQGQATLKQHSVKQNLKGVVKPKRLRAAPAKQRVLIDGRRGLNVVPSEGIAAPVPRQSQAHSARKHAWHGSFCQQEITKHMMEGWSETQNEQGWSNAGNLKDQLIRRGIDSTDFFPGLTKFTKILRKTNLFDIEFRGARGSNSRPYCRPKIVKQQGQATLKQKKKSKGVVKPKRLRAAQRMLIDGRRED